MHEIAEREDEGAEGNGYSQLKIFHNFKILVVSLREVVRLRRVVSLWEVVCASRRLPLRSSHHPRKACITSLKERHHLPSGTLLRSKSDITSRRDATSLNSDLTPPKTDTPR